MLACCCVFVLMMVVIAIIVCTRTADLIFYGSANEAPNANLEANAQTATQEFSNESTAPAKHEISNKSVPHYDLSEVAQAVEKQAVLAATPSPPQFEPLSLDVLPQKYWEPVFPGCESVFTDQKCDYFYPMPRLYVTDLDKIRYERSLEQGRTNLIEPTGARQALAQLLMLGVRPRADVYTQASAANDIASQNVCAQLKSASPSHVRL